MNQNQIEKQTFTYPFFFRIIFRYGNLIITPLLILYTIPLIYYLDEKLICSIFFLSNKTKTIFYEDISSLSGGIFSNKFSGLMKVCDDRNNFCIGFYHRLTNSQKLATIILSKVKRPIYDEVVERLNSRKREMKK